MSRVSYANTPSTLDQQALRETHHVRLVSSTEEGTGVNALPNGVYGFTYSPALPNAPLFAERRFRSYETHKIAGGEIYVIGFADVKGSEIYAVYVHPEFLRRGAGRRLIAAVENQARGSGIEEIGLDAAGKTLVKIDPRYFRPAEVDEMKGNASYAREKLGL